MQNFDYENLDGRILKLFLAVYDTGSFSQAADQFDINQSTVSYSIDKLRVCFSDTLFVKSGRGVIPTERAKTLAPQMRSLLADLQKLVEPSEYSPHDDDQVISLGVNSLVLFPNSVQLYQKLANIAPLLTIRIVEIGSRFLVGNLLESNKIDLAVSIAKTEYPASLSFQRILSSKQVCYFDPEVREKPKSVLDYCDANHAVVDFGTAKLSMVGLALEAASLKRNIKLYAPNIQSLAQLIKGTNLLATMPHILHNSAFSELAFCPCPIDLPQLNMDMVWHKRNENSKRGKWMRDLVSTNLQAVQ